MERMTNFIQLMPVTPEVNNLVRTALDDLGHGEYSPSMSIVFRGGNAQYKQLLEALVNVMCVLLSDPSSPKVLMPTNDPRRPFINTLKSLTRTPFLFSEVMPNENSDTGVPHKIVALCWHDAFPRADRSPLADQLFKETNSKLMAAGLPQIPRLYPEI